ncbi:MAG: carotenoid 1,2-hydratase [Nitrospirae bacterium]|nr:carotenoid 1,2-hydratase [Nitrospirota bacterium]
MNNDRVVSALAVFAAAWVLIAAIGTGKPAEAKGFAAAAPGYQFVFPRDHGPHPAYQTEWWYYTGHVTAESGRTYGYQLTFFRRGVDADAVQRNPSKWALSNIFLAHFAITDEAEGRFHFMEKANRAGVGNAGADAKRFKVWNGTWTAEGKNGAIVLSAVAGDRSILLHLRPSRAPVVHGHDGVSLKGPEKGQASHYYSLTRLDTSGTLTIGGRLETVKGLSWMDHEFGSNQLSEEHVGWDWFGLHLENGMDLMVYRIRKADGTIEPVSSGTLLLPDHTVVHLPLEAIEYSVRDAWTSPVSKAVYPSGWKIVIPDHRIELSIAPTVADQELVTTHSTKVTYWEGSVTVKGSVGGQPVAGAGYVELTGYAKSMGKVF